jgi:hypothetical protein
MSVPDVARSVEALPPTWELVRSLAAFRSSGGCAISLFLDLDPAVTPRRSDLETRLHSLRDQLRKELDESTLGHAQKVAVRADLVRIDEWWQAGVSRDNALGMALFLSSLDGLSQALPLVDVVADAAGYGPRLRIGPLVEPTANDPEGALIVVVTSRRGEIYRIEAGKLERVVDRHDQIPFGRGSRSRAEYQDHLEMLVHRHLKGVEAEVDGTVRAAQRRSGAELELVVIIRDELRGEFEAAASDEVLKAIVGWAHAEEHATPAELLQVARPVLDGARTRRRQSRLERWRAARARDVLATVGWEETLEASADGRVELLLLGRGLSRSAFRCVKCGRPALAAGTCPFDGEQLVRDDGVELAVHETVEHGGTADVVDGEELADAEGIGALLRF